MKAWSAWLTSFLSTSPHEHQRFCLLPKKLHLEQILHAGLIISFGGYPGGFGAQVRELPMGYSELIRILEFGLDILFS